MDSKQKFTEEDKKKTIEFLNFIASKAKFEMNTQDVIKFFGMLTFMQKELLTKINANIFEIKAIHEENKEE